MRKSKTKREIFHMLIHPQNQILITKVMTNFMSNVALQFIKNVKCNLSCLGSVCSQLSILKERQRNRNDRGEAELSRIREAKFTKINKKKNTTHPYELHLHFKQQRTDFSLLR